MGFITRLLTLRKAQRNAEAHMRAALERRVLADAVLSNLCISELAALALEFSELTEEKQGKGVRPLFLFFFFLFETIWKTMGITQ